MNDQIPPPIQQACKLGDDLLRVLMRAVHIVAADDNNWQLEAHTIRIDVHFSRSLGRRIRVCGFQQRVLRQIGAVVLAVDLVGADVDEALHVVLDRGLEHDVRAFDVGFGELEAVAEGEVDVGLGGEVEDGVDGVFLEAAHDVFDVGDVAVDEFEVGGAVEAVGVV